MIVLLIAIIKVIMMIEAIILVVFLYMVKRNMIKYIRINQVIKIKIAQGQAKSSTIFQ